MLGLDKLLSRVSPSAALRQGSRASERGRSVKAFGYFGRAAERGNAEAERRVALCYFEGIGVPPSRTEGVRWLERAADHDDVEAQFLLAGMYAQGLAHHGPGASLGLFAGDANATPDFES